METAKEVKFIKDGDHWLAVRPGFINLMESSAGFGVTQEEALKDLEHVEHLEFCATVEIGA